MTLLNRSLNKTIVALSFVVLFKRGRSLVIALSPLNVRWQLKKANYRLVAPRSDVYSVMSMAGIVFKLASLDHAIEYAVGFFTLK